MSATAEAAEEGSTAHRLGLKPGLVVQEFGYDEDVDHDLRTAIESVIDGELLDEDIDEVVDVVVFWYRDGDGDLVDSLMDSLTNLAEGGVIWLLTPKTGRDGHVEPSDIEEAAPTAGLHAMNTVSASPDWAGTRLGTPRQGRR